MELYGAGNVILHFREKNRLSQPQVCEGICPEATLSRIETGDREYDSLISEVLLGRLGKAPNRFEFVLDKEDYHLYELRQHIKNSIEENRQKEAEFYLSAYEKDMPENKLLHQQFILYHRAMLLKLKNGQEEIIIGLLHRAINLTRPDYKEKRSTMKLFSPIEVHIFYQLFLYEKYTEDSLSSLMDFMMTIYDDEEKEKTMIPFLYVLNKRYEKELRYFEVEKISEKAIEIICSGRRYLYLADFYFSKLKAQEILYHVDPDWEQRKAKLAQESNYIYYMYKIEDNYEKMQEVLTFCEERLQCQITR